MRADFFLSEAATRREVKLPDGSAAEIWVKEAAAALFDTYWSLNASPEDRELAAARLVAASLVTPEGTALLTVEQAGRLKPVIRRQMLTQILVVNGFVKDETAATATGEATAGNG